LQRGVSRFCNLNLKLASVSGIACSGDQASLLQPGEDATKSLALNMNLCGELFLVQGLGCHGFQGDDGGTRQSQWRQCIVVETLD
jgi:hypothetical protein